MNTEVRIDHPSFPLHILTPLRSTSLGCFLPWGTATPRDSLEFRGIQRSRSSFTVHLSPIPTTTDVYIQRSELAINPPVISFSTIRNFDWGPVAVPIQIDGTVQLRRPNSSFSYLEATVWFLFDNDSGLVAQYDITFRRLAWAIEYIKPFLKPQLVKELGSLADKCEIDNLMHLRAAIDICREHDIYCHGADQQYNSTQECIDYIYHQTPLGQVYEWGGNTGKQSPLTMATISVHKITVDAQPCVDTSIKVMSDTCRLCSILTLSRHDPIPP